MCHDDSQSVNHAVVAVGLVTTKLDVRYVPYSYLISFLLQGFTYETSIGRNAIQTTRQLFENKMIILL